MKILKKLFFISLLTIGTTSFANDGFIVDETFNEPCLENWCCEDSWCSNWFVTADFIYWKAYEEGLAYAITSDALALSVGNVQEPDIGWHPGFKVGVGYLPSCYPLDVYLNYTFYHSSASDSVSAPSITIIPVFSPPGGIANGTFASADWNLHYHTLDLELGRPFCLFDQLTIRPYAGLRGASSNQDYNLIYFGGITQRDVLKQKFHGVGPRLGANLNWLFCNHWSFFVDGSYAMLLGRYSTSNRQAFPAIVLLDAERDFTSLRSLADIKVGLGWDRFICNRFHFYLNLAWEQRVWFKYNQFPYFTDDTYEGAFMSLNGDLSLYGINLSAGIIF